METRIVIDWIQVFKWYIIGGFLGVFLCYFVSLLAILFKITKGKFELEPMKYNILMFILSWFIVLAYLWDIIQGIIDPLLYRKYKTKYWYWVWKSIVIKHIFSKEYVRERYFRQIYYMKHKYFYYEVDYDNPKYVRYEKVYNRFYRRYFGGSLC